MPLAFAAGTPAPPIALSCALHLHHKAFCAPHVYFPEEIKNIKLQMLAHKRWYVRMADLNLNGLPSRSVYKTQ